MGCFDRGDTGTGSSVVVDSFSTSQGSLTVLFSIATIGSDGQLSEAISFNSMVVSSAPVSLVWSGVWVRITSNVGLVWFSDKVCNTRAIGDSSDKVGIGGAEPSESGARVEDGKTVSSILISSAAFDFGESTGSFSTLHIDDSEHSVGSAEHGCGRLMLSDALVISSTSSWDGSAAVGEDDSRAAELDSIGGSSSSELGAHGSSGNVSEGVWIEVGFESLSQASEGASDSASSERVSGISVGKLVDSGFMVSTSENNTVLAGEDFVASSSGDTPPGVDESREGGEGASAGSLGSVGVFCEVLELAAVLVSVGVGVGGTSSGWLEMVDGD